MFVSYATDLIKGMWPFYYSTDLYPDIGDFYLYTRAYLYSSVAIITRGDPIRSRINAIMQKIYER